ncbi:putative ABC transport system permease protein [Actinomadura madurae]|uniref:Putative ABC transport system permease protein n=1 Tax=Actinomadura madurae TaxID=1993 RepID=A0A1I4ZL12_9ACTN|nr:FtsX-like permease family protein [Actinomadura madurae]SFN50934.1 putative ABC transport system permease protein [Actinomadura madurae]
MTVKRLLRRPPAPRLPRMGGLVLRGLVAHRARLLMSMVAVVAGVAFVAGTLIFSATLERSVDRAFDDLGRGTDVIVRSQRAFEPGLGEPAPERPVPASVLGTVQGVDGVAKARGVVTGFAAVVDRHGTIVGAEPQTGVAWDGDRDLSLPRLTSGRPPAAPDEVAADTGTARDAGYRIGDRITVALASGTRTFRLTGLFKVGDSAFGDSLSMTAFAPEAAPRLLSEHPGAYARVVVHADDGVSQERLRDAVAATLPPGLEAVTGREAIDEQAGSFKEILAVIRTFLLVFAVIAVFVGSFIIFNTFTMLVGGRVRELALLRAVGASRGQVTRSVLGEAAGVGLAGSALGLAAGVGVAAGLARILAVFLGGEELPFGTPVPPVSAVIASFAVGTLVTLAAAFVPARRASRIPPVAALREGTAPARPLRARALGGAVAAAAGAGLVAAGSAADGRTALTLTGAGCLAVFAGVVTLSPVLTRPAIHVLAWPFARWGGGAGRIGGRNALREPRQTAATASALTIGLALIAAVSVIVQSMASSVERQLDAGLTADYRVTARSEITPVAADAARAVAGVDGVRAAIPIRAARFRVDGSVRTAAAGSPGELLAHFRLPLQAGSPSPGADELLVGSSVAEAQGWRVGSTFRGEYQDGAKRTFRIAGIYRDRPSITPSAPTMIIGWDGYRAHDPGATIDRIEVDVTTATRGALEKALAPWPNVELKDRAQVKDDAAGAIGQFLDLVLGLLVLSVVVAALGIVNTLALAVTERTREIGMLRALGMQRREIRRMIRYEAVAVSLFGALLGVGTGVLLGIVLQHAMAEGDGGMEVLAIPAGRLAVCVAAAALIGVVAAVWPARRAARMDVLQAIATE